jgi:hypothetical protein
LWRCPIFSRRAAPEQGASMATLALLAALGRDRLSRSWYDPVASSLRLLAMTVFLAAPGCCFRTQGKGMRLPACGERAIGAALLFGAEVRSWAEDRGAGKGAWFFVPVSLWLLSVEALPIATRWVALPLRTAGAGSSKTVNHPGALRHPSLKRRGVVGNASVIWKRKPWAERGTIF